MSNFSIKAGIPDPAPSVSPGLPSSHHHSNQEIPGQEAPQQGGKRRTGDQYRDQGLAVASEWSCGLQEWSCGLQPMVPSLKVAFPTDLQVTSATRKFSLRLILLIWLLFLALVLGSHLVVLRYYYHGSVFGTIPPGA